jgi:hypothetical protein
MGAVGAVGASFFLSLLQFCGSPAPVLFELLSMILELLSMILQLLSMILDLLSMILELLSMNATIVR